MGLGGMVLKADITNIRIHCSLFTHTVVKIIFIIVSRIVIYWSHAKKKEHQADINATYRSSRGKR